MQDVNLAEYSRQSAALKEKSLNESSMSHHDQRGVLGQIPMESRLENEQSPGTLSSHLRLNSLQKVRVEQQHSEKQRLTTPRTIVLNKKNKVASNILRVRQNQSV